MTAEEAELKRKHFSRIRRMKRLLRFLPRRNNIHTYPVLRWFASTARKTPYLWSFKVPEVVRALYAGCILTFMPFLGVQSVLALAAALIFRANLPVLVGLQFLSVPLTVPIIYYFDFQIGNFLLSVFGSETALHEASQVAREAGLMARGAYDYAAICLGGLIIGYFAGLISSLIYRIAAIRASRTFARIRQLQKDKPKPTESTPAPFGKTT